MSAPVSAGQAGQRGQPAEPEQPDRGIAEWVGLGISVAIVLTLVGLLTFEQLREGTRAPALVAEVQTAGVRQEQDAFYLPVTVANRGDRAARDVRVRVTLAPAAGAGATGQGQTADETELEFPLLAAGGSEKGTVVFRRDPRSANVAAAVVSYVEP